MCLLIAGYRIHPHYPLIIAANREEAYGRPTRVAHWWEDIPGVLGGRDLEAGGSWMGVSASGRFAALTNYWESEPPHTDPPSRGTLVRDYLAGESSAEEYLQELRRSGGSYNGFNILFGEPERLFYYSNRAQWSGEVGPGVHVISNVLLNTPWPKSERARRFFSRTALRERPEPEELLEMLDDVTAPEEQRDPETPRERLQQLARSSIRIVFPRFGTRTSTALTISSGGEVHFSERSFDPAGQADFRFHIASEDRALWYPE